MSRFPGASDVLADPEAFWRLQGLSLIGTLDQPAPRDLDMEVREDAVEFHLPPVRGYAAAELEV